MQLLKDELIEMFRYENGKVFWAKSGSGKSIHKEAGYVEKDGYRRVKINGKHIPIHRVVYAIFNGPIEDELFIDHINGIRNDNRIENLRLVTAQENQFNITTAKGYCWDKNRGKFKSNITINGKTKHLGMFTNKEDARNAYLSAKKELHIIKDR